MCLFARFPCLRIALSWANEPAGSSSKRSSTAATSQQQRTLHPTGWDLQGLYGIWGGGDGSIWEIVRSKALHLFLGDGDGDAEMGTSLSSSFLYGNFFALAFCCAAAAVVVVALFRSLESGRLVREAMILGACYNEDLQRTIVRLTPAAPLPPTFDQWEWNTQMASWLRLTKLDEIGLSFSQAV